MLSDEIRLLFTIHIYIEPMTLVDDQLHFAYVDFERCTTCLGQRKYWILPFKELDRNRICFSSIDFNISIRFWMFATVWGWCWTLLNISFFNLEELKYGESRILRLFQCQSLSMGSSIWETLTLSCRFVISSWQNQSNYDWEMCCPFCYIHSITLCYVSDHTEQRRCLSVWYSFLDWERH